MELFEQFLQQYRVKKFAKGEVIICEGEQPPCAYAIKSGVVKTYSLTAEGQEKPISFDLAGEVFPVGWVFGKQSHAQYFYEAFSDCAVYCVPRDEFIAYVQKQPELLWEFVGFMVTHYLNFQMRVNALEQSRAADKILQTLHFLSVRFGQEIKDNTVKIKLPMTQQDMANYMGLTRETTGIELKKLERRGIIKYVHQEYVIYTDKLNELLDEEYEDGRIIE